MSSLSANERNFIVSFIQFLRQKVASGALSDEQVESLEVAVQCLEASFAISDADYAFQPSRPLVDTFVAAEGLSLDGGEQTEPGAEPTDAEKVAADELKNAGNALMRDGDFAGAVQKYNEAIKLHRNPVYFCNRAAAYGKLEQHDLAIQDCRTAIALDGKYAKAYGRMGLALTCQHRYQEAVDAYKTALELEPNNESFTNNLEIAQQKSRETAPSQPSASAANPFGFDMGQMLNNPAMMNMATQLMADPNIQSLLSMTNLVSGTMNQPGGGQGIGNLMQVGQQLANTMQQQNPEMVEQLRRAMGGNAPGDGAPPPPPGDDDERPPPTS